MVTSQRTDSSGTSDLVKNQIRRLLNQLNADYQAMRDERHQLVDWEEVQEFSVLGAIESFASDVRGYATQVLAIEAAINSESLIQGLRHLQILDIPYVAEWYFSSTDFYPKIKKYVETLDYLRLLLIEYLSQTTLESVA